MRILGVRVDEINIDEAIEQISLLFAQDKKCFVITPNPEIILYAHKNPSYKDVLNSADLSLADGAGLIWASRFLKTPLKARVSGADLVPEICKLALKENLKIALLGGKNQQVLEQAATILRKEGNNIVYVSHGPSKKEWENDEIHDKIIGELKACAPQIIFVAFGHPKQETWISKYQHSLPSVNLFLGCGGALDFFAGAVTRAPLWMRNWGLEWLWRLALEPKRIKRIFNAVIVFPLTVIYESIWKK